MLKTGEFEQKWLKRLKSSKKPIFDQKHVKVAKKP